MSELDQYLDAQQERFQEQLCDLLRIPSVSTDPAQAEDVRRAAQWVADQFRRLVGAHPLHGLSSRALCR